MAFTPVGANFGGRLPTTLAISDLPPELQAKIKEQSGEFSEGDLDKIDTPNEARALQKLLLGLDEAMVQANPALAQLQQLAQTLDPALLVEMIKNNSGPNNQNNPGRNLGGMGGQGFGRMASQGANAWGGGGGGFGGAGGGGGGGSIGGTPNTGPAQASYPSAGSLSGDRSSQAMQYLQSELGLTREQAAGIVGNLAVESGGSLDPTAIGDNGNARGIAQWNGPRKRALEAFAARQGKSPDDFNLQLQFLAHELKTSESGALASLRRTNTAEEAALAFSRDFERPGIPHNDRRVALAQQALQLA